MTDRPGAEAAALLRRLVDLEEIRQLLVGYVHHLDTRDFAAFSRLFAAEGELVAGPGSTVGSATGPDAIRELMTRNYPGEVGEYLHLVANPMIDLVGDRASGDVTFALIVAGAGGEPVLEALGTYANLFIRESGRWRFLRHEGRAQLARPRGSQ